MNITCKSQTRRLASRLTLICIVLAAATLLGCSANSASVHGKVTFKGQPVTGGTLTFLPLADDNKEPGKSAVGIIQPDGTFIVGTYRSADGTVHGRHQVLYSPPVIELPPGKTLKVGQAMPRSPYDGLVPLQKQVEIKPGSNSLDIELIALFPGVK